jgi:hypothetical protein
VVRQYQRSQHPARFQNAPGRRNSGLSRARTSSPGATTWPARELGGATVRHRLAALSSLFEYLCDKNAVTHNPVKGVKRLRVESGEGKTPAIGDHQARDLLAAPAEDRDQGHLAVDQGFRGRAWTICLSSIRSPAAIRAELAIFALIVDAKDEVAVGFSEHYGFRRFASRPGTLFLPIAEAARRIAASRL